MQERDGTSAKSCTTAGRHGRLRLLLRSGTCGSFVGAVVANAEAMKRQTENAPFHSYPSTECVALTNNAACATIADLFPACCGVAQLVERRIVNPLVGGSSPPATANFLSWRFDAADSSRDAATLSRWPVEARDAAGRGLVSNNTRGSTRHDLDAIRDRRSATTSPPRTRRARLDAPAA